MAWPTQACPFQEIPEYVDEGYLKLIRGMHVVGRVQAQAETPLGKIAHGLMSRGDLLPSELVLSLVTRRLSQRDCLQNGWILDGGNIYCRGYHVAIEKTDDVTDPLALGVFVATSGVFHEHRGHHHRLIMCGVNMSCQ